MAQAKVQNSKTSKKDNSAPVKKTGNLKSFGILGGIAFVALILWWGLQPRTGGIAYGICKTFAEQQLTYPPSMKVQDVGYFEGAIRVFYTSVNPYGAVRSEMMECLFEYDEYGNIYLKRLSRNRQVVDDQDVIDRFNKSIPAIIASNPDLTLPAGFSDDLKGLKTD